MIDLIFIGLLSVIALITPGHSKYKQINYVLVGKFCVFIGLNYLMIAAGLYDGSYVDYHRAFLDILFLVIFLMLSGYYLAFLCALMAVYHAANPFLNYDYQLIMIGFQILQLGAAIWGALDYELDRFSLSYIRRRFNNHSHS